MIGFRLSSYVSKARANGVSDEQIRTELLAAGWDAAKIEKALNAKKPDLTLLIVLVVGLGLVGGIWVYKGGQIVFADKSTPVVSDVIVPQADPVGPTGAVTLDSQKVLNTKQEYINQHLDFIEADLDAKVLHFFQGGVETKSYPILAFGRDGSWWETPTGDYKVLGKEAKHFSSIGKVWMPWSMNFYGNFFIHGWPYYEGGEPVEPGHSGGCIRLSTDDAKDLYQYVEKGTPVLVRETTLSSKFGTIALENHQAPEVSASSFLIANLSTGETYAQKGDASAELGAPIAKLMTAVIASELIYLERELSVEADSVVSAPKLFEPKEGEQYVAFDLLYPLLMQSSDSAANIIASSLGRRNFVNVMNQKAVSLGMVNTKFEGTSDVANNMSTLSDVYKLLQYTYFKRAFLLKLTKGLPYTIYSGEHSTSLTNLNPFADETKMIGIQNDIAKANGAMASVWEVATPQGPVPVSIILAGSTNGAVDTKILFDWLQSKATQK